MPPPSADTLALTWPVAGAVLLGALLHASWNAIVKSSEDQALDTAVMQICGSVLAVPVLLLVGLPPRAAWPYIGASVLIHIGYYTTLSRAYRHGDLGLAYPLMRGTAPLLVALAALFVFDERLSLLAWIGVLAVAGGVVALGLSAAGVRRLHTVGFALANAVMIMLYTLVDGTGVRVAGDALQYITALFLMNSWPFALTVFARRGPAAVWAHARRRWAWGFAGAAASATSYGIALWAMTRAPVAVVAALRETSVLFAAVIGTWFLREAFTVRRAIGTAVIVAGVMALRLG
jgi:phosphonate utilization associated putative membrane protein